MFKFARHVADTQYPSSVSTPVRNYNPLTVTILLNSAITAGLGNIASQRIQNRGKNVPLEYRPVVAFSAYG